MTKQATYTHAMRNELEAAKKETERPGLRYSRFITALAYAMAASKAAAEAEYETSQDYRKALAEAENVLFMIRKDLKP